VNLGADHATALASALPDGVVVLDRNAVVTEVSDRFCLISGFSRDECVGRRAPHPWWPDELAVRSGFVCRFDGERAEVVGGHRAGGGPLPEAVPLAQGSALAEVALTGRPAPLWGAIAVSSRGRARPGGRSVSRASGPCRRTPRGGSSGSAR
jgi:PAS domain-containing protein